MLHTCGSHYNGTDTFISLLREECASIIFHKARLLLVSAFAAVLTELAVGIVLILLGSCLDFVCTRSKAVFCICNGFKKQSIVPPITT